MKNQMFRRLIFLCVVSLNWTFSSLDAKEEFFKVSITVDVELKLPKEKVDLPLNRGLVTAIGSGSFAWDFCFDATLSEETLVSEGFFQLTHYESLSFGSAKDCSVSLNQEAYEPRTTAAQCKLVTSEADFNRTIQFRIPKLPTGQMLYVNWNCGGIDKVLPDPATMIQLYLPLCLESWNFSIEEGEPRMTVRRDYPLHNGTLADLTFAISIMPFR